MVEQPKTIGAIAPSSRALARAMAAQIPLAGGPVLELGPGTGAVTDAILESGIAPSHLTAIEFDRHFAARLKQRFPGVTVITGDAFDMSHALGGANGFAAIVSSLPLLNFPAAKRRSLLSEAFARLAPGAPFIQFSYGLNPPIPPPEGGSVVRTAYILFNLPPARVWVYRMTM